MKVEKASFRLALFIGISYTLYIIGKMSFSAATVGLVESGVLTKTETGMINGIFWLVYAIGQIIGAIVVNKVSAYLLIEIGIWGSVLSNIVLAGSENFIVMLIAWCLGGMAQSGLWPGILKLVTTEVTDKHRMPLLAYLAYAFSIGSVISYFLTAAILKSWSWKYIFAISGIIGMVAYVFIAYSKKKDSPILQRKLQEDKTVVKEKLTFRVVWERGLILFSLLLCLKTIVENGVGSWMPTILTEMFGFSSSNSSLLSVVRLLVALAGVTLGTFVYALVKSDELKAIIMLAIPILPVILVLNNLSGLSATSAIVLFFAVNFFSSALHARISLNYPARYQDIGLTPTIGAIMNCMYTGGMAIANYGGGYIADQFGWIAVIRMWTIVIILVLVIAFLTLPIWKRFKKKYLEK